MKLAGKFDPLLARGKRRVRADVEYSKLILQIALQQVDHLHLSHLLIQRH
jgi:hypothetical protein